MFTVNFVTTNKHKFAVAQHFFSRAGLLGKVELKQYDIEVPEIQEDSVEEVALSSARWAAAMLKQPVVVTDAGLSIPALNGFPGPYMKYLNATLAPEDLLRLMKGKTDQTALFVDALAYYDPTTNAAQVFKSITPGTIASHPANHDGSTVDVLFVPDGHGMPLADMAEDDRKAVWNTSRWQQLAHFLQSS